MMDDMNEVEALDHIREIANRLPDTGLKAVLYTILGAFASDEYGKNALYTVILNFSRSELRRLSGYDWGGK